MNKSRRDEARKRESNASFGGEGGSTRDWRGEGEPFDGTTQGKNGSETGGLAARKFASWPLQLSRSSSICTGCQVVGDEPESGEAGAREQHMHTPKCTGTR